MADKLISANYLTEKIRAAIKESESPWTHYGWVQKLIDDAPAVQQAPCETCWRHNTCQAYIDMVDRGVENPFCAAWEARAPWADQSGAEWADNPVLASAT